MGDVHGRDAELLLDALDGVAHFHAQLRVQVGQRLVHQQHLRLDDDGAGERHALLLAAGEVGRHAVLEMIDLDDLENAVDLALYFILRQLAVAQAEGHVIKYIHVREYRIILEHHADVPFVGGDIVDDAVVDLERTAFDGVESDDHAEKRCFAAAGGTQQREKLARLDFQRQAVDDRVVAVALDGVFNGNGGSHRFSSLSLRDSL